jgi:hypothetical protein
MLRDIRTRGLCRGDDVQNDSDELTCKKRMCVWYFTPWRVSSYFLIPTTRPVIFSGNIPSDLPLDVGASLSRQKAHSAEAAVRSLLLCGDERSGLSGVQPIPLRISECPPWQRAYRKDR